LNNEDDEDFVHALFVCSWGTQVWSDTNLWNVKEHTLSLYGEPVAVVFCILQKFQPKQCPLFATILWNLWKCRNLKHVAVGP